jgi:small-conductance mechanosensitive channel
LLKHLACALTAIALLAIAPTQAKAPAPEPAAPAAVAPARPGAATEAPEPGPVGPELDKIHAILKQVVASLEGNNLTDAELVALRQKLEPVAPAARAAIERLEPRLATIQTSLDQLGPKPNGDAESESPAVTAERSDQQKNFSDANELLKHARVIAVQADQITTQIAARRRALFTHSLFERTSSISSAKFWTDVASETSHHLSSVQRVFRDWINGINVRLDDHRQLVFWGSMAAVFLLYAPFAWLARRVLARSPATEAPSRFLKITGAWWIALTTATPAIAAIFIVSAVFDAFDLSNARLAPFFQALSDGVFRIAITAGIARGLFAPNRSNWRLPQLSNAVCQKIAVTAICVATIVSLTRAFEALNDVVGASLTFSVAMRSLGTLVGALTLCVGLWGLGDDAEAESAAGDLLGPQVTEPSDWFGLLRVIAWTLTILVTGSVLVGYAAFGSFLLEQMVLVSGIAGIWFMATILVDEAIATGLKPTTRVGHRVVASIGLHRGSLEILGVLISGMVKLALFIIAAYLALAPWGVQSTDVPTDFRTAFFGFKVGDVTISLASIIMALAIFALLYLAIHTIQRWFNSKLLPQLGLDSGLNNSIKTSLGYIGFIFAAGLSLSYLGLNVEKLALVAGALSVGIGFGLQSIVNNFLSGLILLWERAVRVGDWIVVGGDQGFVRKINVRSTEIETFDLAQVIIPNSSLITGVVKNLVRNNRTGRLVIPLTVAGTADPEKVREVLFVIAKSHELVLKMPTPQILFTGMSASALEFELRAYIADVEKMFRIRSDLHFEIFKRFKAEGFFASPPPAPTKIQIAGIEQLDALQKPPSELAAEQTPRSAASG